MTGDLIMLAGRPGWKISPLSLLASCSCFLWWRTMAAMMAYPSSQSDDRWFILTSFLKRDWQQDLKVIADPQDEWGFFPNDTANGSTSFSKTMMNGQFPFFRKTKYFSRNRELIKGIPTSSRYFGPKRFQDICGNFFGTILSILDLGPSENTIIVQAPLSKVTLAMLVNYYLR